MAADPASLDALNRRLWTWVEGEYHRAPHRCLDGETPLDKWAAIADEVRYLGPDIDDLFLSEAKRKVARDRIVSLGGIVYEVDASLVGEAVTLRKAPIGTTRRGSRRARRPTRVPARSSLSARHSTAVTNSGCPFSLLFRMAASSPVKSE